MLLSQGVPMILAGDEFGRTQQGNNNAYCQDNRISWVDWQLSEEQQRLLAFSRALIQLRKAHPVLHRRTFFQGRSIHGLQISDIEWYRPDGQEMAEEEWTKGFVRCLGMVLNGQIMDEWDARGHHVRDDVLLLLLNAHHESISFTLPGSAGGPAWEVELDTAVDEPTAPTGRTYAAGACFELHSRSLAVLRQSTVEREDEAG
jgi:isoamylase